MADEFIVEGNHGFLAAFYITNVILLLSAIGGIAATSWIYYYTQEDNAYIVIFIIH